VVGKEVKKDKEFNFPFWLTIVKEDKANKTREIILTDEGVENLKEQAFKFLGEGLAPDEIINKFKKMQGPSIPSEHLNKLMGKLIEVVKAGEIIEWLKKELMKRETAKQLKIEYPGKALIPSQINTITGKVLTAQLRERDRRGREEVEGKEMEKWQRGDIEYLVEAVVSRKKLGSQPPKVYVSQHKSLMLLLAFIEQQQFNREDKKAEASFLFEKYGRGRGYTDEEIKRGGKFLNELRRDLFSGAYTTYRIRKIKLNGVTYTAHGIPNFYTLFEPEDHKKEWRVIWNPFYKDSILEILEGKAKQYFTHYLKEIADRKTTEKPYLHFFYNQLVYRRQIGKSSMPKKVINLLKEMGTAEKFLKRPGECFNILRECLVYTATNYPEELESIMLYNNFNKEKIKFLPLGRLKALGGLEYKDFKGLLKPLGIEDVREAFISFGRQKEGKKELPKPKPQDNSKLIDQTERDKKKIRGGAIQRIIDYYSDKFLSLYNKKPAIVKGKASSLLKGLLKDHTEEELKGMLDLFLRGETGDEFIDGKCSKSLGVFCGSTIFNKLLLLKNKEDKREKEVKEWQEKKKRIEEQEQPKMKAEDSEKIKKEIRNRLGEPKEQKDTLPFDENGFFILEDE